MPASNFIGRIALKKRCKFLICALVSLCYGGFVNVLQRFNRTAAPDSEYSDARTQEQYNPYRNKPIKALHLFHCSSSHNSYSKSIIPPPERYCQSFIIIRLCCKQSGIFVICSGYSKKDFGFHRSLFY